MIPTLRSASGLPATLVISDAVLVKTPFSGTTYVISVCICGRPIGPARLPRIGFAISR